MKQIQNVLKEKRNEKNLTQKEVADYLNISQQAYAHYESGKRLIDIDKLIKLADLYQISLDILSGRYGD